MNISICFIEIGISFVETEDLNIKSLSFNGQCGKTWSSEPRLTDQSYLEGYLMLPGMARV